jgi:hypothetical protein
MPGPLEAWARWDTGNLRLEPVEIARGSRSSTAGQVGDSLRILVSCESFRIQGLEKKGFVQPVQLSRNE